MESITVRSAVLRGVTAEIIEIHIERAPGAAFTIEGLPEAAAREARFRVRSALAETCDTEIRVTIRPGGLRGAAFDLPIAMGILALHENTGPIPGLVMGELSLSGDVRSVRGVLPALEAARAAGLPWAIVPAGNAAETVYGPPGFRVRAMRHLGEPPESASAPVLPPPRRSAEPDLCDVPAMHEGRKALEVAVATGQNLLLVGPPGSGKTMLARRATSIMPDPTTAGRREIAQIQSAAGLPVGNAYARPFRAPHHTASAVALVGGGDPCRPGEVTLAHAGVLFLDELPEFSRASVQALLGVVREGRSTVARANSRITMPARPLIVGAMNACPCGKRGSSPKFSRGPDDGCTCSPARIEAWWSRVAPLREIFPLAVRIESPSFADLRQGPQGESSATVRARIAARDTVEGTTLGRASARFAWDGGAL